jgi:hypothetical protein
MRKPPHIWLLSIAIVVAVVLVAALGRGHSAGNHRQAAPSATATPPTIQPSPPSSTASVFAKQYVRYLGGETNPSTLTLATAPVRRIARQAGPIPPRSRSGQLRLISLQPVSGQQAAFTMIAHEAQHTLIAQFAMAQLEGQWRVIRLVPPDFAVRLASISAPPLGVKSTPSNPSPPPGARAAALAFVRRYLLYSYGRTPASGLKAITATLQRTLAAQPPRVPTAVRSLTPSIRSLTLEHPDGRQWTAIASVTDGQRTYLIAVGMVHESEGWAASSIHSS